MDSMSYKPTGLWYRCCTLIKSEPASQCTLICKNLWHGLTLMLLKKPHRHGKKQKALFWIRNLLKRTKQRIPVESSYKRKTNQNGLPQRFRLGSILVYPLIKWFEKAIKKLRCQHSVDIQFLRIVREDCEKASKDGNIMSKQAIKHWWNSVITNEQMLRTKINFNYIYRKLGLHCQEILGRSARKEILKSFASAQCSKILMKY